MAHEDPEQQQPPAAAAAAAVAPAHAAMETNKLSHAAPNAKINEVKSSATLSIAKHNTESAGNRRLLTRKSADYCRVDQRAMSTIHCAAIYYCICRSTVK